MFASKYYGNNDDGDRIADKSNAMNATMSEDETHVEILDAVAAAAVALNHGHHNNTNMEQQHHVAMPVSHLPPPPTVHNPVQHEEEEVVTKTENVGAEQHEEDHHTQEHNTHVHHANLMHEQMNMSLEELSASLHEPPIDIDPNDTVSMLSAVKQLQHMQRQQSQLILHMRGMIHDLQVLQCKPDYNIANTSAKRTSKESWQKTVRSSTAHPTRVQTELITAQLASMDAEPRNTTDEEVDFIVHNKREQNQCWPVHRLKKWIEDEDLQKIRMHRSMKHNHVPIRIPRTDKNKEGRLICKLCSGGKCNRNTTWMCSTCEVPLCIDLVDGDSTQTHHVLWHMARDLREEHERCNAMLRERRIEKKRGSSERVSESGHDVEQVAKRERLEMAGMIGVGGNGALQRDEEHEGPDNEVHESVHHGQDHRVSVHHGEEHSNMHHGEEVDVEPMNVHIHGQV